jgi:putative ABC transport system permease protein
MAAFWRRRPQEDFSDEIRAHLEHEVERLIESGMTPQAARHAARKSFGNVVAAQERYYEANRWMWFDQLWQDLRYGWRGLRQSPAFLLTTVLTLAVGLSIVTIAFTIFNVYVLRPFAVADPSSLYGLGWRSDASGGQSFRWTDYEALRERTDLFDAVIADATRFGTSEGRTLSAAFVSDNYLETLSPGMRFGRPFTPADGEAPVVVLSDQGWGRLFARDPRVLGKDLELDGRRFTVIGVLRPEFTSLDEMPRDLWIPIAQRPARVEITARLRAAVTPAQAQAALTPLMTRIVDEIVKRPEEARGARADLRSQATPIPLTVGLLAVFAPIFAAFALVLVTACANVSNVMLSRAIARHKEIAVRLSLGASRARIVRQLLTEGLVIAVLAGAAGLGLAAWALRAGTALFFTTLPPAVAARARLAPLTFDRRVFLFAFAAAAATALLFALVPALRASRAALTDALRGQRSGTLGGSRLRSALVVGQVAVSLVLVVVALTLARNGAVVAAVPLGFDPQGVISLNVRGEENEHLLARRLAETLAADPRAAEVAVTAGNPMFIRSRPIAASPPGAPVAGGTRYTFVSPEYFSILRIPIQRGRPFSAGEAAASARVAIVSGATAQAFWPGADPIGRTIRIERPEGRPVEELPGYAEVTVVGVAGDVVSGFMVDGRDAGHIYLPMTAADPHAIALLVRPRGDRALGPDALQEIFRRVSPDPERFEDVPLAEMKDAQMYVFRAAAFVGSLLGAIALVLSVAGLYGVLAFTLSQRTREIGIRMALGATAGAVVRLVMAQSARLAGIGALIGLAVAFAAMKVLSAVVTLHEVSFLNLVPFAGGALVVALATIVAAFFPARRATHVDPAETLRAEA